MKYIIYLFSVLFFALAAETTWAANFSPTTEFMVAANNAVELDVTMEMLDENAESSSDIINVIELPVQEMRMEQIRNERQIRQDGDASPLRPEQGSQNDTQSEIQDQFHELHQGARDAQRAINKDVGQQRGR